VADYSTALKKLLIKSGCFYVRQAKGDHEIWYSPLSGKKFPVDYTIKSRHTANKILNQAGLDKVF